MEEQPSRNEMVRRVCCLFQTNSQYSHYCFNGKLSKGLKDSIVSAITNFA